MARRSLRAAAATVLLLLAGCGAMPAVRVATPVPAAAAQSTPGAPAARAPAMVALDAGDVVYAGDVGDVIVAPPPDRAAPEPEGARSVVVAHGSGARRRVALTFDAGADAGHTTSILDELAGDHITASFGMTGAWAEAHPALLRRIVADGHQLLNHSYDHASFTGLSTGTKPLMRAQRWAQLDRTEAAIERIAPGARAKPYFRPPYGDVDASVLADVGADGYAVTALWSVDSLGWNGLSAEQIAQRTLRLATPGAVLIFHVGAASADAEALPAIVRGLREHGYDFASVAALLAPEPAP